MNDEKRRELLAKLNLHLANGTRVSDELKAEIEAVLKEDVEGWKVETMIDALKEWGGEGEERSKFETRSLNKAKLDELLRYLEEHEGLEAEERERIAEMVARMVKQGGDKTTVEKLIGKLKELRELDKRNAEKIKQKNQNWSAEQAERMARRVSMEMVVGKSQEEVEKAPEVVTEKRIWETAEEWVKNRMGGSKERVEEAKTIVAERIRRAVESNKNRVDDVIEGKSLAAELEELEVREMKGAAMEELGVAVENLANKKASLEVRKRVIESEVILAMAEENPDATAEEVAAWGKMVAKLSVGDGEIESEERVKLAEGRQGTETVGEAKVIANILSGETSIGKLLGSVNMNLKLPTEIREIRVVSKVLKEIESNPAVAKLMEASRKMVVFEEAISRVEGTILARIGGWIGSEGLEKLAVDFTKREVVKGILTNSMLILSREGMTMGMGLKIIGSALLEGGSKKLAEVAAIKAGEAVASKGIGAALAGLMAGGGPPAWLVTAAVWGAEKVLGIFGKSFNKTRGWLKETIGFDVPIVGKLVDGLYGIAGFIKKSVPIVGGMLGAVVEMVPKIIEGLSGAIAEGAKMMGWVVVATVAGLFVIMIGLSQLISTLVPSIDGQGGAGVGIYLKAKTPELDPNIPVPESCPEGWPVREGVVTQGPNGTASHYRDPGRSIDIAWFMGTEIYTTHDGVAVEGLDPSGYGYFVDVHATCNGKKFVTRYAHLSTRYSFTGLLDNKRVNRGGEIGLMGNTGYVIASPGGDGTHLHYQLFELGDINDWLPVRIDDKCSSVAECNVEI